MPRHLWILIAGAVGGTLCDRIHVACGVLDYPAGALWGQPLWVPPLFASACWLLVTGMRTSRRLWWPDAPLPVAGDLVRGAAWFLAAYAASGLVGHRPLAAAVLLYGTWIMRLVPSRLPRTPVAAVCLVAALLGTAWEMGLSATGAFSYLGPDMANVPSWLPALYLHGALTASAIPESR